MLTALVTLRSVIVLLNFFFTSLYLSSSDNGFDVLAQLQDDDMYVQGNIVCQLGDLDLSTFCIRQLALLSVNDRQNMPASQRAVVHSFFKNYDRVHFIQFVQ